MSVIDEVKERIDIVDLVSETVKLRHAGKNYTGFCPFHPNSRTPAFVVFPDSGTWRCFGQCNEGGDVFRFVMKKEGWDFNETLKYLAEKAGVELKPLTPEKEAEDEASTRLRELLEESVNFYRHHLTQTPAGQPALAYLAKRGLTPATIESFGLGYAPDAWDSALNYFTGKGYTPAEIFASGIAVERQGGGYYDRFRNRILFPIRDAVGHMAGFGARILNPEDMPKFINTAQTALFDKGRLLFGLDQARKAIRAQDQVVIVEGYLDVIVLQQCGFTNTVSPMGTALTEDQLRQLKKFTRRIVLALDADAAGEKATLRGLELARQTLDRSDELTFDARGLLHHEARLQADVRVTTIPAGMDPDEVALRSTDEWQKIIEAAQPIVVHVMETLSAGRNLDDAKIKTEIAAQVLPLIEDVPSPVERDSYRQRLARLLKIDERSLAGAAPAAARGSTRRARQAKTDSQTGGSVVAAREPLEKILELHLLTILANQPELLYQLDRRLQQGGLSRFDPGDFSSTEHQLLARRIQQSLEQDRAEPHNFILNELDENLVELVQRITKVETIAEIEKTLHDRLLEDLLRSLCRLRLVRIRESLNQLRFLQQDIQEQGENSLKPYQDLVLQYSQDRDRLDKLIRQPLQLD